jgi:perosamine synthetase
MSRPFIPVNEPLLNGREKAYLIDCIETGWISGEGPYVERLERRMAHRVGRKHGIALSNGSMALEIAVAALGIQHGDEVILPTFTIISCAAAIIRAGAVPITVDCDGATWNMNPDEIEDQITSRTRAIMAVHIYGLPVDVDAVQRIADRYGLCVIEDAAEMLGQTYRDRPCGSFGTLSTFSFYSNKIVTTGEGGMILTNDDALAARCRSLRNNTLTTKRRFVHESLGWNARISNLQAALGVAQLERLDRFVKRRHAIGAFYNSSLVDETRLQRPVAETPYARNIYWAYGVVLDAVVPFDAEEAMQRMKNLGVGTRPFFWPMHEQPVFINMGLFKGVKHPEAERIARRGFYLPTSLSLKRKHISRIVNALKCMLS